MEDSSKKTSSTVAVAAVVALVVGLAIGFGISKATSKSDTSSNNSQSSVAAAPNAGTKAADLRTTLVKLGLEHMTLTDQAINAALAGAPDKDAVGAALYANGNDIGAAVGSVYGADAEKTFDSVWKTHLDDFVSYAVASSKGDTAGKTAALDDISTKYTKPLAAYLAKANPNLPQATLEGALNDHVMMTATMIDDHTAGKFTDEQAELKMANDHITGLFSTLAGGIVKQYPSKF